MTGYLADYASLEVERNNLRPHLEQCSQVSDTVSMHSITNTEDSNSMHDAPVNYHTNQGYQDHHYGHGMASDDVDAGYDNDLDHGIDASKMSSHLLESCLRELEDRGTLNSGYIRDSGNMDYMQEDPYAGHRFQPHDYGGGGGGGSGGYHDNYAGNSSFDHHSEQSYHSDRNRMPDSSYSHLPNGGPYSDVGGGSGNNSYAQEQQQPQDWNRSSPQPHRSLTPQEYPPPSDYPTSYADSESRWGNNAYDKEATPYHNLPPRDEERFRNSPQFVDDGVDDRFRPDDGNYLEEAPPPSHPGNYPSASLSQPPDTSLHDGYGDRDGSYAGSRGSFQGPGDPAYSGNYNDPYASGQYNGNDQYPPEQGSRNGGPSGDYSFHGDPQAPMKPPHVLNHVYDGSGPYDPNRDPRDLSQPLCLEDDRYPQPEDYRDVHNRSTGPVDDPYNTSYNPQPLQHDNSFREPYTQPTQNYDPYESERFSDRGPQSRQSYDQGYNDQPPPQHPNESFQDMPDNYGRYDGLPPVQSDPFADDPFQNQPPRQMEDPYTRQGEDPYFRGSSPAGGSDVYCSYFYGPDPGPYNDQGQPYPGQFEEGDPRFQGQPYPGDMPYQYNQGPPVYPEETGSNYGPPQGTPYRDSPYYPEEEAAQRLDQLNLNAPPPMDGRHTPSMDGRGPPLNMFGSRNPDLQEVIDFLKSDDDSVKASAAAYLQHLTYMDDDMKAKTRATGGIPALIQLLNHELIEVHKSACGALRNLSYGRNNNDNKRAIKNENGIPELIRLLRKTDQDDVKESVTSVLWNLSSCEDLKQSIIEDGLTVLVNVVISKYAGYNAISNPWTTVLRNTTGILRNVSSAGFDARKRLRECRGMINSLIYILKIAVVDPASSDVDNKPIENTVCILRNLSYRIQEVIDSEFYKKRTLPRQESVGGKSKGGESPGCFGSKSKKAKNNQGKSGSQIAHPSPQLPAAAVEYRALWGSEIHALYSTILRKCTNPITMEAAAGAIQNLTACDWPPAVDSREMVRKEKGLPLLVDLLSAESERVVCATATALRNLAFDDKNKELIGKYAICQLVNRLPRDDCSPLQDDTICAVIATLFEVVKDNVDFASALVQEDALPRLMMINRSDRRYLQRTLKFALTLLKTLYGFKALHNEYNQHNYTAQDFTTSDAIARKEGSRPPMSNQTPGSSNHTTPYNTLSRPMANQGYDDNTLTPAKAQHIQRGAYHLDARGPSPVFDPYSDGRGPPDYNRVIPDYNRSNMSLQDNRDHMNYSRDRIPQVEIPLNDLGGPGYAPLDEPRPHQAKPPVGGVPLFPTMSAADPPSSPYHGDPQNGSEPLYAQVNKGSRRRLDPYADSTEARASPHPVDGGGGADSWV